MDEFFCFSVNTGGSTRSNPVLTRSVRQSILMSEYFLVVKTKSLIFVINSKLIPPLPIYTLLWFSDTETNVQHQHPADRRVACQSQTHRRLPTDGDHGPVYFYPILARRQQSLDCSPSLRCNMPSPPSTHQQEHRAARAPLEVFSRIVFVFLFSIDVLPRLFDHRTVCLAAAAVAPIPNPPLPFLLGDHNRARGKIGLPDLKFDLNLAVAAQEHANFLAEFPQGCEVLRPSALRTRHAKLFFADLQSGRSSAGVSRPPAFYYVGESVGLVDGGTVIAEQALDRLWGVDSTNSTQTQTGGAPRPHPSYRYGRFGHACTSLDNVTSPGHSIELHISRVSGFTQALWAETTAVGCALAKCIANPALYNSSSPSGSAAAAMGRTGSCFRRKFFVRQNSEQCCT